MLRWFTIGVCIFLSGCLLPDRYEAELTVLTDGSYTLTYDGEFIDVMTHAEMQKKGLTEKQEAERAEFVSENFDIGVNGEKLKYKGKARYSADFVDKGDYRRFNSGSIAQVMKIIDRPDGTVSVRGLKPKDGGKIPDGLTSQGDICIITDMEVIEHNANSTPGWFSKCYRWKKYQLLTDPELLIRMRKKG
ncbi:hypothetical protein [Novispirillum itersonii]|uniref:Lipoprotein n=1 Tax=Novispirillum itersonii TaxID=189 RepID=A0A7X0DMG4_NOVIT|nr:hypothetical protein [Novispirillum itersonii]MBB6211021.1 hypothetical protein [Novispirillum itersonii]